MISTLRTIAYHVVGQPWISNSKILKRIAWGLFFRNRFVPRLGGYHYFSQCQIEPLLERRLGSRGFYIEIGSNDGLSFSNTKYLEMYRKWSGVLIEPFEAHLETSKLHRSRRNSFVHAACVTSSHQEDSVELFYSNMMTTLVKPTEDQPDPLAHALKGANFLQPQESVHIFRAPAKTLREILQAEKCPSTINFLSIDIEGHDYEILKDFDWSYKILNILIECDSPSATRELLTSKGYEEIFSDKANNYFFSLIEEH